MVDCELHAVQVQGLKISLRQKRRVKVNGEFVKLPYLSLGLVTIYQDPADNYNIVVKLTDIGELVTFDARVSYNRLSVCQHVSHRLNMDAVLT